MNSASSLITHLAKTMSIGLRGRGVLCRRQESCARAVGSVGGGCAGNGKGKDKAFCEQQAQHDQAAGRACRATVGACDGCLETRHGEGSAQTDPERIVLCLIVKGFV